MELGAVHLELHDRPQLQLVGRGGPVGVEVECECPPHPVVVEQLHITRLVLQGGRVVARRPLTQRRLVVKADVANGHPQGPRRRESGARATPSDGGLQPFAEGQAVAEVVDNRQSVEHLSVEV
ncbi:MAG: hypothetical protein M0027_00930 [Candidatus Dormibacteraeota bacterium]|nr:hypothetical protein [Candidatus Dormibacteraeota bacterium]